MAISQLPYISKRLQILSTKKRKIVFSPIDYGLTLILTLPLHGIQIT